MIEVKDLSKNYGDKQVLNHVSFSVQDGEIVGFLGPNGAGKSTTMNIITGYLSASSGSVLVDGLDVDEDSDEVRKLIGYLPEQPPLYLEMTVEEYLKFVCGLKRVSEPHKQHLDRICEMVGVQQVRPRVIRNLSKGYRQRVGLAQALIGDPKILILDEPTVGLDPIQMKEIRNVIRTLGTSRTVILSSHILPEVQSVCERMLVLNAGTIIADGTSGELSHLLLGHQRLHLCVKGADGGVMNALSAIEGIAQIRPVEARDADTIEMIVDAKPDADVRDALFFRLAELKTPIYAMNPMDFDLEEIFLQLTAARQGEPAAAEKEGN